MSFEIVTTRYFLRKLKRLSKKYPSLKSDLDTIIDSLEQYPKLGKAIGYDCYKIRIAISSKGKGKSGGARLITCLRILNNRVYLLDIYDKSEQEDISDAELRGLIEELPEE
jgi:mRNA-degrading endonuclease RelE of RelBE toxin-antitoxin system